jgi:hypothetical protein
MAGGAGRAHISQPIARPGGGFANRPGGGGNWAGRPGYGGGWNNAGWGYRPGYGLGAAAAVGAGVAYGAYGNGYYGGGYYEEPTYSYQVSGPADSDSDAIAECARRFRTYDPASQTYIRSKGVRASCP